MKKLLLLACLIGAVAIARDNPDGEILKAKLRGEQSWGQLYSQSSIAPHDETNEWENVPDTNAPVYKPWSAYYFNSNWLAANSNLIDGIIVREMLPTNNLPYFQLTRTIERNNFVREALNSFRYGLVTNTYGTNFEDFNYWARTNHP